MFRSYKIRNPWGILFVLLILVLVAGCLKSTANEDQAPEAPSSLTIDNNEANGDNSTEEEAEPVDSFIKTTELLIAEDGSAVVVVTTQQDLTGGVYQARYYGSDGSENTAPCEQVEGSDNDLQCSLVLGSNPHEFEDGFMDTEVQVWGLDLGGGGVEIEGDGSNVNPTADFFEPVFDDSEDFTGINFYSLFDHLDVSILPPEFHISKIEDHGVFSPYVANLCADWDANGWKPDSLDVICPYFGQVWEPYEEMPCTPEGVISPNPISQPCLPASSIFASTMPDPDCEGKDAGSFWCQQTEDEPYIAGQLATACLQQISAAFEDPLTAFEDPLTAFEDPLTAFEDPLTAFEDPLTAFEDLHTAFEDPLTAFEDPLTAEDVARTTILYHLAKPNLPNAAPLTACNQLAFLGDAAMFQRYGMTLLEFYGQDFPLFKPISDRIPLDTSGLTVMPAHCARFDETTFYSFPEIFFETHSADIRFRSTDPLPGIHYFVFGDPTPYHYRAELGGISSQIIQLKGENVIAIQWNGLDESLYGQDQEYALYVTGCEEPLATGIISMPEYSYDRCEFFEDVPMSLHVADPSTDLSIYLAMANGVPGLEEPPYPGYDDQLTWYTGQFCGEQTRCEVFESYPGRLYCDFTISPDCLDVSQAFTLRASQCGIIFSQMITVPSATHGGGGPVDDGDGSTTPACTGTEPNKNVCEANGGTWSGSAWNVGTCTCP